MNTDSSGAVPNAASPSDTGPKEFFDDPSRLMRVLGDPARWIALRELAGGRPRSLVELAGKAGRTPNQMGKHLAVLRKLGIVTLVPSPDGDGRKMSHRVPDRFIRTDVEGRLMLDLGVCVLRFGDDVRADDWPDGKD